MKNYQVAIEGRNFLIKSVSDTGEKTGFKTFRVVSADNPEEAEKLGVEMIRREPFLTKSILNKRNDPPLIYVTNVAEYKKKKINPIMSAMQFFNDDEHENEDLDFKK